MTIVKFLWLSGSSIKALGKEAVDGECEEALKPLVTNARRKLKLEIVRSRNVHV